MKKHKKINVKKIVKRNTLIDMEMLNKYQKEANKLKTMGVTPSGFGLVIPYSKSIKLATD